MEILLNKQNKIVAYAIDGASLEDQNAIVLDKKELELLYLHPDGTVSNVKANDCIAFLDSFCTEPLRYCYIDGKFFRIPEEETMQYVPDQMFTILQQLNQLDEKSNRPLRSVLVAQANGKEPSPDDIKRLAEIEAEAVALRQQLAEISGAENG